MAYQPNDRAARIGRRRRRMPVGGFSVAGQMDQVKERLQAIWEAIRDAMAPRPNPKLVPIPVRVKDRQRR